MSSTTVHLLTRRSSICIVSVHHVATLSMHLGVDALMQCAQSMAARNSTSVNHESRADYLRRIRSAGY